MFIHSTVDGHLRCFHLSASMDAAAMDTYKLLGRRIFLLPLRIYPRGEMLAHLETRISNFWGTAKLFSKTAAPFDIPSSHEQGFTFSTSQQTLGIFQFPFQNDSHPQSAILLYERIALAALACTPSRGWLRPSATVYIWGAFWR